MLFGEGEEKRDHVYISDVAEIIFRCIAQKSEGTLNVATGVVVSFREIAEKVVALAATTSTAIRNASRQGPMPHNGYRPFDTGGITLAFPDFSFTSLETGLLLSQREEFHDGRG